ncbi:MAG: DUF4105 domain-containing protein [Verrucomicrobia bacterium]|nr:DUF4105 domain-containing protein [Verrucomicrobiota bacterium]
MGRLLRSCWAGLKRVAQFLLIAWSTLAIYYSNLPWAWARIALAVVFAVFAIWAVWVSRRVRLFAGVFVAVVAWWICIPPSQERPWRPEVAVLPKAVINGDHVLLTGYRNFTYRSRYDFDSYHEEREVDISHVVAIDLFISYLKIGPVAHTFVSFDFDDGSLPVCISIEARPEIGEEFNVLGAMFKEFELIYVVGDERDIVRVRTNYRNEDVFLYHIRATPEAVRRLFRIYLERINELADRAEWYHLLSNNCTLNILRYARAAGLQHSRFDYRFLLNGLIDRFIYAAGVVDTSLGFEELRRRSHINEAAHAAGNVSDFSARIRASLPARAGPND